MNHASVKFQGYLLDNIYLCLIEKKRQKNKTETKKLQKTKKPTKKQQQKPKQPPPPPTQSYLSEFLSSLNFGRTLIESCSFQFYM